MWLVSELVLLAGGILAASGFIVSKKPNAKELIDKLVPYQGWIGVVMFIWGVWDLIHMLTSMSIISLAPVLWIFGLIVSVTELGVGFLLGFGMASKWMSSSPEAIAKGQQLRAKLVGITTPLGFVSIAIAVIFLLWQLRILPVM